MRLMSSVLLTAVAVMNVVANTQTTCSTTYPDVYAPMRGSDGVTYDNDCELNVVKCQSVNASLVVTSSGKCPDCQLNCPDVYSPVCGSNGATNGNECELNVAKCQSGNDSLAVVSTGECPSTDCEFVYPAVLSPVCSSNGVTYGNGWELKLAQCTDPTTTLVSTGKCASPSSSGSASDNSGDHGCDDSSSGYHDSNDLSPDMKAPTPSMYCDA